MILRYFLILVNIHLCAAIFQGTEFEDVQRQLETPEIISRMPMQEFLEKKGYKVHFNSEVFLVELKSGLRAVLKLTDPDWPNEAIAEVAAFRASQALQLHLVPPTAFYDNEGEAGSLQYYVESPFDLQIKDNYKRAIQKTTPEHLADIALFYFVFGQWDPGPSNLIAVEKDDRIQFVLIDNAAMASMQKVRYGEHPFVRCFEMQCEDASETFPFDAARILPPDAAEWKKEFGETLREEDIRPLCRLQKPIPFVIWKGHFWRQYGFGKPSYTDVYPQQTIQRLQDLDSAKLKELFGSEASFNEEYFSDILERRDQVVQAFLLSFFKS